MLRIEAESRADLEKLVTGLGWIGMESTSKRDVIVVFKRDKPAEDETIRYYVNVWRQSEPSIMLSCEMGATDKDEFEKYAAGRFMTVANVNGGALISAEGDNNLFMSMADDHW